MNRGLKFSANLALLWPEMPILDRVREAAQYGFGAVEFQSVSGVAPEQLREMCYQYRLELVCFNSDPGESTQGEFGLAALKNRINDFDLSIERAINYANRSGASAIHVLAGIIRRKSKAEARRIFIENVRRAARAAFEQNIALLLEPMNPFDRPDYFYSKVDEVTTLITEIGCQNVQLMFDVYHVAMSGDSPFTQLEKAISFIGHVQIAAVPSRTEPDEGRVNYREVIKTLESLQYSGWIGCEYYPRTTTTGGLKWMRDLCSDLNGIVHRDN